MLIDSHCHIQFSGFDEDRKEVLERCKEKNMRILHAIGTQSDTSKKAVDLALESSYVYASVGIHPIQHYAVDVEEEGTSFKSRGEEFDEEFFDELVLSGKVIGIGETGLDKYHIPNGEEGKKAFEAQKELFQKHIDFAVKHEKPLVIHVRDGKDPEEVSAHEDMIAILEENKKKYAEKLRGVIHCFSGNLEQAKKYLDLGFYLGFAGNLTFPPKKTNPKPQEDLLEVLDFIPVDRTLIETDAPFLAPQKYRGKKCEPWMCEEVLFFIAERHDLDVKKVEERIEKNFFELFGV